MTGYQDFLSALAILLSEVPGLGEPAAGRPAPHVRLVFGVDTGSAGHIVLGAAARRAALERQGLWIDDAGDPRAILAIDAIEAGCPLFG